MQKIIILAVRYPEEKEEEVEKLLLPGESVATINSEIGEVWKPYQGPYSKTIDNIIDDLTIFNATPEEREKNKLIQKILLKRCMEVQKLLKNVDENTDKDLAFTAVRHVEHCSRCQGFVCGNFNVGGTKELEFFIQRKLNGEKFKKL